MRAAIYARFSSELLDERSIVDQIAVAKKYVETRGLTPTQTYQDGGPGIFLLNLAKFT